MVRVALHFRHLRDDVGDGSISNRHQVDRAPHAGHVVGQPFVDPQRHGASDERCRNDVELELVGELVDDRAVEQIRRFVDRHDDPVPRRFGKGLHAFLRSAGNDVLLLELAVRLEQDQRHLVREVVLQFSADVLIRAFRVARDPLEVLLDLRVVVNLEVFGRVDLPLEVVVADLVLAEVGNVRRLR